MRRPWYRFGSQIGPAWGVFPSLWSEQLSELTTRDSVGPPASFWNQPPTESRVEACKLQQISFAWLEGCTSVVFQIENWWYSGKKRKQIPKFERQRMDAEDRSMEGNDMEHKGHCVKKKNVKQEQGFYIPTYHTFMHFFSFSCQNIHLGSLGFVDELIPWNPSLYL